MQTYYLLMTSAGSSNELSNYPVVNDQIAKKIKIPYNFKILIVDDDKDFLQALSFTFHKRKINYLAVESGCDALKALEHSLFDLILLDLRMPDMDGVETLRRMIELKKNSFVVIMTAYYEAEKIKLVKQLKPFGFLKKPFEIAQLLLYIEKRIKEGKK